MFLFCFVFGNIQKSSRTLNVTFLKCNKPKNKYTTSTHIPNLKKTNKTIHHATMIMDVTLLCKSHILHTYNNATI